MKLALAGIDALRMLRALRCNGTDVAGLPRTALAMPDTSPYQRLRANRLDLAALRLEEPPTAERKLDISVPSRADYLRASFVHNSIAGATNVPADSFINVTDELQIPCPELIFLQVSTTMLPVIQLALGMELCGEFSRNPFDSVEGEATLGVAPATTAKRLVAYLDSCHGLPGITRARQLAAYLCDNAWSPMEGAVAALFSLPFDELGYDLAPLTLNQRFESSDSMPSEKSSRVPDILFTGTHVGLNYDGRGHLGLDHVVQAATAAALQPDETHAQRQLQSAVEQVRSTYVDDRRRDRELWAQGLEVMPVTIEDLRERGRLDAIVGWALEKIEAEGTRDLSVQKAMLTSPVIARERQRVVWSLLPGKQGREARASLTHNPFFKSQPREGFSGTIEW